MIARCLLLAALLVVRSNAACRKLSDAEVKKMSACDYISYSIEFGAGESAEIEDNAIKVQTDAIATADCKYAARFFQCADAFRECGIAGENHVCRSTCQNYMDACGGDKSACDAYPDVSCTSAAGTTRVSAFGLLAAVGALLFASGSSRAALAVLLVCALALPAYAAESCQSIDKDILKHMQSCGFVSWDTEYDKSDVNNLPLLMDADITASTNGISDADCKYAARIFRCASAFPKCSHNVVCQSTCLDYAKACKGDASACVSTDDAAVCTSGASNLSAGMMLSLFAVVSCLVQLTGMSRKSVLALTVVAILACANAQADICTGLLATKDMTSCGYIKYDIFKFTEANIAPLAVDGSVTAATDGLSGDCKYAARLYYCAQSFLQCPSNLILPIPCKSTCENAVTACGGDVDVCAFHPTSDCTSAGVVAQASAFVVVVATLAVLAAAF